MGRLIENHGAPLPLQFLQVGAAVLLVHGQEALEGEPAGGQAGHRQGGDQGAVTRDGHHIHPILGAEGHQLLAGVGHRRGARVGDQGAALPGQQAAEHRLAPRPGVVAVIGEHGLFQPQVVEQLEGHPGILRGNKIHLPQGVRDAPGDVPQVADGGGYQIQRSGHVYYLRFDSSVGRISSPGRPCRTASSRTAEGGQSGPCWSSRSRLGSSPAERRAAKRSHKRSGR